MIELLAVIAILALLAALAFQSLSIISRKAHEADAVQDLRSLHAATVQYASENNGELIFAYTSGSGGWADLWIDRLAPYLPPEGNVSNTGGRNRAFYNSRVKAKDRWLGDYAPNENVIRANSSAANTPPRLATIREPSKEIMYLEGANNDATKSPFTSGAFSLWAKVAINGNFDYPNTIARRHGDPKNPAFFAVFCDGHTERISFQEFSKDQEMRRKMLSGNAIGGSIYQ